MAVATVTFYDRDSVHRWNLDKLGLTSRMRVPTDAAYVTAHPSTAGGAVGNTRLTSVTVDTSAGAASGLSVANLQVIATSIRDCNVQVVAGDTA